MDIKTKMPGQKINVTPPFLTESAQPKPVNHNALCNLTKTTSAPLCTFIQSSRHSQWCCWFTQGQVVVYYLSLGEGADQNTSMLGPLSDQKWQRNCSNLVLRFRKSAHMFQRFVLHHKMLFHKFFGVLAEILCAPSHRIGAISFRTW